ADLVRQHAEQKRTDKDTEQSRAEDRAENRPGNVPVLNQGGSDVTHRLNIESIDDEAKTAKSENPDLKCAQLALVYDFRDVDTLFHNAGEYITVCFGREPGGRTAHYRSGHSA